MSVDLNHLTEEVKQQNHKFKRASEEIAKVIVGQKAMIEALFLALLGNGHLLLEGLPGLAKTLAATSLAQTLHVDFKRIQFTPDLLPADLIGTSFYNPKEATFSTRKGPIFTNILLADEINRAPAKVQAALLEIMQERQVTISGETFFVEAPFMVLATQNPIEQEGTYPLPEAETDRFMMKVLIDYPSKSEEKEMLKKMGHQKDKIKLEAVLSADEILEAKKLVSQIFVDEKVTDYILNLVEATRKNEHLLYGASPRASIAFVVLGKAFAFLRGRAYVTPEDIKAIAHPILRHRLRRSYEAEAEEITPDQIIDKILEAVPVP